MRKNVIIRTICRTLCSFAILLATTSYGACQDPFEGGEDAIEDAFGDPPESTPADDGVSQGATYPCLKYGTKGSCSLNFVKPANNGCSGGTACVTTCSGPQTAIVSRPEWEFHAKRDASTAPAGTTGIRGTLVGINCTVSYKCECVLNQTSGATECKVSKKWTPTQTYQGMTKHVDAVGNDIFCEGP